MRAVKMLSILIFIPLYSLPSLRSFFSPFSQLFSETTATSVGASVLSASSCFAEILVFEKLLEHVIIPDMLCS